MNSTLYNNTSWFMNYSSYDLELVNMIQSGVSCVASVLILIKVFDVGALFKSVREKRLKMKKEKERRELERVRKLINSVKNNNNEVDINELLSSGDDNDDTEVNDAGVLKIARKKNKNIDSKV